MEWAVFIVFAVAALAGAVGVVLSRKPVHAALFLVLTLFCVAVFFVLQEAHFLAAVQVIVYAGAVVILFLFVIMLLGVDESEDLFAEPLRGQRPVAAVAGVALVAGLLLMTGGLAAHRASRPCGAPPWAQGSNIERWPAACSPTSCGPSRSPPSCWSSPWSAASSWPGGHRDRTEHQTCEQLAAEQSPSRGGRSDETSAGAYYLVLAALIFAIGAVGLLVRRNALVMFMCVELMLNAVNLTFVTFSRMLDDIGGQVFVFFTLVVAAAEVVVGLALIVAIFRRRQGATADDISLLRG